MKTIDKIKKEMESYHIQRSRLKGSLSVPPSKSHTMRALVFAALAEGKSIIHNVLDAPDTRHMLKACELLGARYRIEGTDVEIEGVNGNIPVVEDVVYAGNSGLILRFIAAIAGLCPNYTIITGDHSIRHLRPMKVLLSALNQLGVEAISARHDGMAPLIIKGHWKGGQATFSGEDSQYVSSLLIAGSFAAHPSEFVVQNPGEKPFVEMTLSWLRKFNIPYTNDNYERYTIAGKSRIKGFEYTIPGDWSSAAFPIAAALVTHSELTLENIDFSDVQGDKEIVNALKQMGADIEIREHSLVIKPSHLKGQTIDVNPFIDAITILTVLGCFAEGETRLVNAAVARQKECDRLKFITAELKKMGADIIENEDNLIIQPKKLKGTYVNSHHDHRMAMSLAVAGLNADGVTVVQDTACVVKTFPEFDKALRSIGAHIRIEP